MSKVTTSEATPSLIGVWDSEFTGDLYMDVGGGSSNAEMTGP